MGTTGRGYISAKLFSLGKRNLYIWPLNSVYVRICVCACVFNCKCSPKCFVKYLLTEKQIFGDNMYCKRVFQRRNGYNC